MRNSLRTLLCSIAASALVATLGGISSPVSAQSTIALPDCVGKPQVRPSEVIFACGDANFLARRLQWTGWGERFAAATGIAAINDCTPYCAAGHFHNYRVVIIASGHQSCPDGHPAYTTVTYAFVGRPPFAQQGSQAANPTVTYPCHPRA